MLVTFFCSQVFFVNSSPCSYHGLCYGHAMYIGNSQKEARYLSFPVLSLPGLSLARFKITADILIAFAGEFFSEEIARRHRVAIMLFKLKSVLYPPGATAINQRFFLAVAYEPCITMTHFRFGDKIETSLNLFSLFISKRLSFRDLRLGAMKTQTPGNN